MKRLEFAIQMENEGEKYYLSQAALHQTDPLHQVFEKLAHAEHRHADLLLKRAQNENYSLDDKTLDSFKGVFDGLANFKSKDFYPPDQLAVYRLAITLEQKSIELYQAMLNDATDENDRVLLKFLVDQEKTHLALFDELEVLLNRPVDWIEAAEFGKREEY